MNAPTHLEISTADGSGQNVHPDVVYMAGGFAGFAYWMALTPYPRGDDRQENPALRASVDGVHWVLPDGVPDPIVPPPADPETHHADPDLVIADREMILLYMTRDKVRHKTTFSYVRSHDARSWSAPTVVYRDEWGVSPSLVRTNDGWAMWFVVLDTSIGFGPSRTLRRTGKHLESLSTAEECALDLPGYIPWHLDVQETDRGLEALVAAFPVGTDTSRTSLFHVESDDGLEFRCPRGGPLLEPAGLAWDGRTIYRSSFTKHPGGHYQVWYTGGSWNRRFGIGYLEGQLNDLRPPDQPSHSFAERMRWLPDYLVGYTRYRLRPLARTRLVRVLRGRTSRHGRR